MKPPRKVAIRRAPADVTATDRQGKGIGDIEAMRQMATKSIPEILSMTPGIGEAMSLYDAQKAASEGDALGTGLGLAGAIPIAGTLGRGAGKLAKPIVGRIPTLYHGTGAEPFSKFLREKMGKGLNKLGVAGYGTTSLGEAVNYIKSKLPPNFGQSYIVTSKGNKVDVPMDMASYLRAGKTSLEDAIQAQQKLVATKEELVRKAFDTAHMRKTKNLQMKRLEEMNESRDLLYNLLTASDEGVAHIERPGTILELGIDADPSKLLDYEKELYEQTPFVQQAVMDALGLKGPVIARDLNRSPSFEGAQQLMKYNNLLNSRIRTAEGSKLLEDAGIQGLRAVGSQDPRVRNYAIFDPDRISVLRNLGLLGMLTGGASMYNQPSEQPLAPSNRMR